MALILQCKKSSMKKYRMFFSGFSQHERWCTISDPVYSIGKIGDYDSEFSHCFTGECRVNFLPIFYRISQIVSENANLGASLPLILSVMEQQMKMLCGMVSLYDRSSGTIFIHDSFGMTEEEQKHGIYTLGEGITGKVVETGSTIIVQEATDDTSSQGRTGQHARKGKRSVAIFCIPIMHAHKVLGTIGAERHYMNARLLKQDVEILSMIAAIIAPAAELYLMENLDKVRLETENLRMRNVLKERFRPSNIMGNSKPMQQVYDLVYKVAGARTTVLILGESGVGKELVANAIHYNGSNADGPFVSFNCAALPESIAESELFGHEKGAFTGAAAMRKGRFEMADGGTIFLDEIGELTLSMQAKLLRVLQLKTFERVGGNRPVKVDVRIIAATNRNLAEMVERGTFREDLYYRLNVFPIVVPPLRDRGSDVITLADHFVSAFAAENRKIVKRISTPAINMLMSYHWPGNVRELENVIERSVLLADDDVIHSYNLPPSLQTSAESGTSFGINLESKLQAVEYEMIVEALKSSGGHIGDAARELGLTRRALGVRMGKHNITYKSFRTADMRK